VNDRVHSAVDSLGASISQTLGWLAERKNPSVSDDAVSSAVKELMSPVTQALGDLHALAPNQETSLADCILACGEVPDGTCRDDNVLSWRCQRESFAQNVAELESWTRWAARAIRAAARVNDGSGA
jgi:hypothetical protein